jgi:hypothetical protein
MHRILNKRTASPEDSADAVYIGRSGMPPDECFGNPFAHRGGTLAEVVLSTRDEAVDAYEAWLRGTRWEEVSQERRKWILSNLMSLQGKDLLCHCAPQRCHGEVLIKLMNEMLDEVIREEALDRDFDIEETIKAETDEAQHWTQYYKSSPHDFS